MWITSVDGRNRTNYGKPPVMGESEKKVGKTVENARCPPEQKRGLTRRRKCDNIYPAVKEQFAGIAQSVEQLIRNQQVVCSSHITSSTSEQSPLCSGVFLCQRQQRRRWPAHLFLRSKPNPLLLGFGLGPPLCDGFVLLRGKLDFNRSFQLVASGISLATGFCISLQSASRAHSAAPRVQTGPASLGFGWGRRFAAVSVTKYYFRPAVGKSRSDHGKNAGITWTIKTLAKNQ